jgi:polar amino acid transport system substrate-binding protein
LTQRAWWWWFLIVLGSGGVTALAAQGNDAPGDKPPLRWGGDKGGGGPFVYEDRDGKLTGFEVQIADYLATKLGRKAEFVQGEWQTLPQNLTRGDIDCIINGYEWSPDREQHMLSTIPYYVYRIQLVARKSDDSINGWDDLRAAPGRPKRRVGVLARSASDRYLDREFRNDVAIVALDEEGTTGVMRSVESGHFDATVQDTPTVRYYVGPSREFPNLHAVGDAIEPGYFVIYVRRDDTVLRDELNAAIRQGLKDGTFRRIYEAHGLWNAEQESLLSVADDWPPEGEASKSPLWRYAVILAASAVTTVLLSFASMPLAILLGLTVAVGRLYGPRWLNWVLTVYVEVLRGTPLLLQLWVIYFLLPEIHVRLDPFWAGVIGLAMNYSAYEAENYRAGLLAIPKGQMEAALALGMSTWTALRRVVIPQAVRIVIPPVTNDFIALFKDTSVCSVIAVTELTGRYRHLLVDHPHDVLELGILTALLYLLMSYPLSMVARRLERRFPKVVA